MTPGIKSPKMKAGNGLPSNMMMKPCGGPMMTASKGSPLNAEGDERKAFAKELDRQTAAKNAETAAKNAKIAADNKSSYKKKANRYRRDVTTLSSKSDKDDFSRTLKNNQKTRIKEFETNLFNNDKKNKPGSTKGYTASEYAIAKTSGRYKSNKDLPKIDPVNPIKDLPPVTKKQDPLPPKKTSFKSAYDKRDKKIYGNLSQSQFTAESKRQIASKKAGKGYDSPKKQMGKTPVVKPVKTQKGGTGFMGGVTGFMGGGKNKKTLLPVDPKANLPQKDTTKTVKSKTVTTAPKEVKSTRLSKRTEKTRAKGEAALASGDKQKALRLRRRVDRQEARSAKREVRGAKREAIKKINNKKTVKVVEPKKIVKAAKPKDKKKSSSGLASGPRMHKGDGKKHAKIQETPEMRAKYVKSLIAKGYEPVKGTTNQFRRGTRNGVLTIGEYTGNIPNNDSPAEEIRKAMKAGDARRKKENKKIKK